ncbi:hypothetical protein HHI36_013025 [Cryptolaemus montrouzieri]|uniref:HTH psq-type domain-containing protein n=1 Tax=Cryptolaemus montrouzieri TaxID=559131 RepID=A0ABD2NGL5_9CUCU
MADSVLQGKMSYDLAAKTFGVPQISLEREVKMTKESSEENAADTVKMKVRFGPKQTAFSYGEGKELCSYILDIEIKLYGKTTKDLRGLVYRLAIENNTPHPFNDLKKEACETGYKAI